MANQTRDGYIMFTAEPPRTPSVAEVVNETLRKLCVFCGSAVNPTCPFTAGVDLGNTPVTPAVLTGVELGRFVPYGPGDGPQAVSPSRM